MKRELEAEAAATALENKSTDVEARNNLLGMINTRFSPEVIGLFGFIILISCVLWLFQGSNVPVKEAACFSVSGVYFICPLTGEKLKKSERETHIKEAILLVGILFFIHNQHHLLNWNKLLCRTLFFFLFLQRFSENPVEASVMMIHTFNKDREKVKGAIDIISK